jgi:hypothetical protein
MGIAQEIKNAEKRMDTSKKSFRTPSGDLQGEGEATDRMNSGQSRPADYLG